MLDAGPADVPTSRSTERLTLRIGDLDVECISTPGGETVDVCVVWLPQHAHLLHQQPRRPDVPALPELQHAARRQVPLRRAVPRVGADGARAPTRDPRHGAPQPIRGRRVDRHVPRPPARRGRLRAPRHARRHQRRHRHLHAHARDPPARPSAGRPGVRPGELGRAHDLGELPRLVPPALDHRALSRARARRVRDGGRPRRRRRARRPRARADSTRASRWSRSTSSRR